MFEFLSRKKKESGDVKKNGNTLSSKLVVLVVLDGLGISTDKEYNAVVQAETPFLNTIWTKSQKTLLHASGTPVGLPDGEVGNSEVGHLNIGAGRVVYQSLPLINDSIMSGQFQEHPTLLKAIEEAKNSGRRLHLMGILSAGGVHGHIAHLFELLEMCRKHDVSPYVHAFMDGRDVGITDGYFYLTKLFQKFNELGVGQLASMSGRFYSMDRDNRWERVQLAYESMVGYGKRRATDPFQVLQEAYAKKENDQILLPTTMVDTSGNPVGPIQDGDVCIMYNYREDRTREITKAFAKPEFEFFPRRHNPANIHFVALMGYEEGLNVDVVFPPKSLENTLASVVSDRGLKQLHISETEKFAHVTYFLNGGIEQPHEGEEFYNIPSKKVFDYAETPEMSAGPVTEEVISRLDNIAENQLSLIVVNFANPDMLGHTGDLNETAKSINYVDLCTKRIVEKVVSIGGVAVVTADHGNAEYMYDSTTGQIDTKHTTFPVPFILVKSPQECKLLDGEKVYKVGFGIDQHPAGMLADIAPTVLSVLQIEPPSDMTGFNLLDAM